MSAETCERQTISRPPAWPLDLALEDAQLVPEDQELEPEAGVRASAIDEGIEEQTADGMKESEKHDRGILAGWILVAPGPPPRFLTAQGPTRSAHYTFKTAGPRRNPTTSGTSSRTAPHALIDGWTGPIAGTSAGCSV